MSRKKTLSASIDHDVFDELQRTVRETGRSRSAVITSAVKLYASLPPVSRRALDELERAQGRNSESAFLGEVQRALLRSRWEMLAARVDREVGELLPAEASEEELLDLGEREIEETRRERSRP